MAMAGAKGHRAPAHGAQGGGTIMHLTGGRGGAANGVVRHGVMNKNGTNKRQTGTHIMEQYRKSYENQQRGQGVPYSVPYKLSRQCSAVRPSPRYVVRGVCKLLCERCV